MHFLMHVMFLFDLARYVIICLPANIQFAQESLSILRLKHLSYALDFQLLFITCSLFQIYEKQRSDFFS